MLYGGILAWPGLARLEGYQRGSRVTKSIKGDTSETVRLGKWALEKVGSKAFIL